MENRGNESDKKKVKELRARLRADIKRALLKANPGLEQDAFQALVASIVENLFQFLGTYLVTSPLTNKERAERNYSDSERHLIATVSYLFSDSTGDVKLARDIFEANLNRIMNETGLEFSSTSREVVFDVIVRALAGYTVYVQHGDESKALEAYNAAETRLLSMMESGLVRARDTDAHKQFKTHIEDAISKAGLDLEPYQIRRAQDLFIGLLGDYFLASEEERALVYSLGEERIIFTLLAPTSKKTDGLSLTLRSK